MNKEISIFSAIYNYTKTLKTKIGKEVQERFEYDDFDVIVYNNVWYIQTQHSNISLNKNIYKWLKKYIKKTYNCKCLFDV